MAIFWSVPTPAAARVRISRPSEAGTTNQFPNPQPTPFSPSLGVGTQINDFSKNDGFAPYSEQWNVNVQRRIPYDMFVTAAWVGNRVIHLPSQLNTPNQLDPKYFCPGQLILD